MKNYTKIFLILFIFSLSLRVSFGGGLNSVETFRSPEDVVIAFYTDYLSAFNNPDASASIEQSQNAIDKYTSRHLQNERDSDDSGGDYFIAAQDICTDWIKNLKTEKLNINDDSANLELTLGVNNSESNYDVRLKRKDGRWLIDSVKFESRKSETCNQD
ncbi:DUF3828 domain-containing protein [Enterobacter sp. PTB]|uniref:DUF3828 domain-containing protein n=1 Tax=Enterobacter sp. PTB TaxID=3143437 RepID=UPI003DA8C826